MSIITDLRDGTFGRVYTSTYIIEELITYTLKKISLPKAKQLLKIWVKENKGFATILDVSWTEFLMTSDLFLNQEKQDRLLSFTDCRIVINSRAINIDMIVTFDGGFHKYMTVVS